MKTSVLILNQIKKEYFTPIITNADGKIEYADKDFNFSFGKDTEVSFSCSVTWRGQFFVFGGEANRRQISILNDCQLERIGSLSFDHYYGGCGNVDDEEIYLCFNIDSADNKKCRYGVDPLGEFIEIEESFYPHLETGRIGASNGFFSCLSQGN